MGNTNYVNIVRVGEVHVQIELGYIMTKKCVKWTKFTYPLDIKGYHSTIGDWKWKLTKGFYSDG